MRKWGRSQLEVAALFPYPKLLKTYEDNGSVQIYILKDQIRINDLEGIFKTRYKEN